MSNYESALGLKLRNGLIIKVPPSLSATTTYVLLEQEEWFEKEINFLTRFLKPGMTAIDIGANLGVYSIPIAHLVSPGGNIISYEPGSEARALLEDSRKSNGFSNLEIVAAALSNQERDGHLGFAATSEQRALDDAGIGERVRVTSLDSENGARSWRAVDFVKIDAEGEEERIINGGRSFFGAHSPLVMFEIRAANKVNENLRTMFSAIGYKIFRQLGGNAILVPVDAAQPLDDYELNLFAAKPDRAQAMSQQGLLVDPVPEWLPEPCHQSEAITFWRRQIFASQLKLPNDSTSSADADYQNALTGYAIWRANDQTTELRCAALAFALQSARAACTRALTVERASTWARIAWEWGARGESVTALQRLLQHLTGNTQLKEPFWPAAARFDDISPDDQPLEWFAAAAAEQYERTLSFSSLFSGPSQRLAWLGNQRFASAEIVRRRVLTEALAGKRPKVPKRLCEPAVDHLNADVWRSGAVPGTVK
jgi:FkbM family methyltransferase